MNSIGKIEDYSCHGRYNDDGKPTHTSEEQVLIISMCNVNSYLSYPNRNA